MRVRVGLGFEFRLGLGIEWARTQSADSVGGGARGARVGARGALDAVGDGVVARRVEVGAGGTLGAGRAAPSRVAVGTGRA